MRVIVALAVVLIYAGANYAAHHLGVLEHVRGAYVLVVPILAGIVAPAIVLARFEGAGTADLRRWGVRLKTADAIGVPLAAAAGVVMLSFAAANVAGVSPARVARLAAHLVAPSVAESFVFNAVLFNVVRHSGALGRLTSTVLALASASVAFGLYHFTFYPPWNTVPVAARLVVVWVVVTIVFLVTRSVWAASAFNTMMAVTGFVVNGIARLDAEPIGPALIEAALALASPWMVLRVYRPATSTRVSL